MASCATCGLSTGTSHRMHDDLKACLVACKDAVAKLSRYRLLEGNEAEMTTELRQETLEIAMRVHSKDVHIAVSDNNGGLVAEQRYPKNEGEVQ
jgi:coenzyme F420-reducing hydrogenase beta subunit